MEVFIDIDKAIERHRDSALSPAEACDQHAHHQRAHQAPDGEDGDGEGVHEGQRLLVHYRAITAHHRVVVEVLDVLQPGET